jgi:hypothetical protein
MRDPRVEPRVGDVLRLNGVRATVLGRYGRDDCLVVVRWWRDHRHVRDAVLVTEWQRIMAGAVVVKVAHAAGEDAPHA